MPIRPSERGRYPANWREISARIKARAQDACEGIPGGMPCRAPNGQRHPVTGSIVVLTVAHLGCPSEAPFILHMARPAATDQVIDLIGFFVPLKAKRDEWRSMMHDRTVTEFATGAPASGAGFVVAFQGSTTSGSPARPVVFRPEPTAPVWVRLTAWSLLSEPTQAADIATEPSTSADVESRNAVDLAAAFARTRTESALRGADVFVATGVRASLAAVSGLLAGEIERDATNHAVSRQWAASRSRQITDILYHLDHYPENCADENLRALCQRCHLTYDAKHHAKNAARTRRAKKQNGELFA